MSNTLKDYQTFETEEEAEESVKLLVKNDIEFKVKKITGYSGKEDYTIQIKEGDFEIADNIFQLGALENMQDIESDYYLYEFSNEELEDIINKKDEWGEFDFLYAQKLLKERGNEISHKEVASIDKSRKEEVKNQKAEKLKPKDMPKGIIALGYIFSFLGGIIGITIGWSISSSKKTLPSGEIVFTNTESDRKHGNNIMVIGFIVTVLCLLISFVLR